MLEGGWLQPMFVYPCRPHKAFSERLLFQLCSYLVAGSVKGMAAIGSCTFAGRAAGDAVAPQCGGRG